MDYVLQTPGLFRRHRSFLNLHDCASSAQWYVDGSIYECIFLCIAESFDHNSILSYCYLSIVCSTPVTYGYALQQCVHESVLGVLVAFSAIVGIIGSIMFPFLRKRLNVTRFAI